MTSYPMQRARAMLAEELGDSPLAGILVSEELDPTEHGSVLNAAIRALTKALTREDEVRGERWQPIETAPKDGTRILLWLREPWSEVECASWYEPWGVWSAERASPSFDDDIGGIGALVPTPSRHPWR